MPLGPMDQIAITTSPRPTHGGYSPPALHQPANHPQTNNSDTYPRALKRGGRRRRTPPTTTTITGNTSTRTQTIKSGQLTLLNPSPRHQNYTTPPHQLIGDCRLVQQHPLSLPTRGFRNNGGLDLSGLGVLALPPPDPPYVAIPLDCGGQPPHTWHDDLRGFFKHPSTCLWTVPRAQALLRGRAWVAQLWAKSVGAVRLRALPLSLVQQGRLRFGVSRCGPAAAVVGRGC